MTTREDAAALLKQFTTTDSLIKHALTVEAAMRWYAKHFGCDEEEVSHWGIAGLLHDFDYERYPDPTPESGHPYIGNSILAEHGYSEEIRTAIMGHAAYTGVARESMMAKTLFAVDELCGLITASALVRPDKRFGALVVKSVKKKFKDKAFAKGCNREDITLGATQLGIPLEDHMTHVIEALAQLEEENPSFSV